MKRLMMSLWLLAFLSACTGFRGPDQIASPGAEQPAAEGGSGGSRYQLSQDRGPDRLLTAADIQEEQPFWEPPGRAGNQSPYTVLGRRYHVLPTADGFVEEGIASWYGKKFHGHKTSNGEVFDMYRISAAHTRLPIPTWVRVTNLENNQSIVVRVNDRGPFHPDRVIDLSYAAAVKLDMQRQGTARVRVEVLNLPKIEAPTHILQLGAFTELSRAQQQQRFWREQHPKQGVNVVSQGGTHRLQMGPMGRSEAERLQADIQRQTGDRPLMMRAN